MWSRRLNVRRSRAWAHCSRIRMWPTARGTPRSPDSAIADRGFLQTTLRPHPYDDPMRRWPSRILICLALGAVLTVAIAFACARWQPFWIDVGTETGVLDVDGELWTVKLRYRGLGWDNMWLYGPSTARRVPEKTHRVKADWARRLLRANCQTELSVLAAGLPFRCFTAYAVPQDMPAYSNTTVSGTRLYIWHFGFVFDEESGSVMGGVLPLRPDLLGFAANTVIYAISLWGLTFAWKRVRREHCRRRGLCPKCVYDLRGDLDAGCSECGWRRAEDEV